MTRRNKFFPDLEPDEEIYDLPGWDLPGRRKRPKAPAPLPLGTPPQSILEPSTEPEKPKTRKTGQNQA